MLASEITFKSDYRIQNEAYAHIWPRGWVTHTLGHSHTYIMHVHTHAHTAAMNSGSRPHGSQSP